MNYTDQLLFFFGAIGVFNSILVSLYFIFVKKPKVNTNILFGIFLLFLSERALRALVYFFSDSNANGYSSFGPITFIFIGPFLFHYVMSALKINLPYKKFIYGHISFWVLVAIGLHFFMPFRADPIFWKRYILLAINLQWLVYLLISAYHVLIYVKRDTNKIRALYVWLSALLLSVLVLWLIYFFTPLSYFVIGSIIFSILFYSLFLYCLFNKKWRNQIFQDNEKYLDKKIESQHASVLLEKLHNIMLKEKLYKDPNIKLSDIATKLDISKHQFSQLLNDNVGQNFPAFINEYRIEEAKRIIRSNSKYTLDAIGNESGFNSKSTFYTVFKRIVGMTPAKYKAQS